MGRVTPFHSKFEADKPVMMQVYHCNDACSAARALTGSAQTPGAGGYRMCKQCDRLNRSEPRRQ